MTPGILLCADLDRTILPNGPHEESPIARPLLRAIAERPDMTLAYVSGRNAKLQKEAIEQYSLPVPDFAIGDVGTTIYETGRGEWTPWEEWTGKIAADWRGFDGEDLAGLFKDFQVLRLQDIGRQSRFKLSYYAPADVGRAELISEMRRRLGGRGVRASLIWSVDEAAGVGLLDILPEGATKLHAIRFLLEKKGFSEAGTVFAGDSGNDLPVLASGLNAVLVRNAAEDVREEAAALAESRGVRDRLYLARGGFLGMNGCYAAGVLEGLAHFIPDAEKWLEDEKQRLFPAR